MMQNKKRKKRTTLISITLFIITMITTDVILTINSDVFAYTVPINFAETLNENSNTNEPPPKEVSDSYKLSSCPQILGWATIYDCSIGYDYSWKIKYDEDFIINGYSMDDEPLFEEGIKSAIPIKAGTSIGISLYSEKIVGYEVKTLNVKYYYSYYYEVEYTFDCIIDKNPETEEPIWGKCEESYTVYGSSSTDLKENTSNGTLKAEYIRIKKEAIDKAVKGSYKTYIGASTYEVIIPDSNDIKGDSVKNTNSSFDCYYKNLTTGEGILIPHGPEYGKKCQEADYTKLQEERIQMTYFTINKACVERKTGIVRYITSSTEDCNAEEIAVENGVTDNIIPYKNEKETHWHYFVPLNAKSTDSVSINIRYKWISEQSFKQCKYIMDNNPIDYLDITVDNPIINPNRRPAPFYTELISKKSEQPFKGDYYKCDVCADSGLSDEEFISCCLSNDSTDFYEILNDGCRLSMQTLLPVTQDFYLESKDENDITWLKGFNFYYRPIDISKNNQIDMIFPNGAANILGQLKNATLWEKWYKAQKNNILTDEKNPDLSKSFEDKTYSAINISHSNVRKYNNVNSYTDWNKMNLDGTSQYIDNEGIIMRNNTGKVYELGCGPLNINKYLDEAQTQINLLYRKECDNS